MKKLLSILIVAALLLPVLAGCQRTDTSLPQGNPPAAAQPEATTPPAVETPPATEYITPEEAKAIALQDAGLTETEVRDLEVDLDLDDGAAHYDVDFEKGLAEYDYEIDAVSGKILRTEKPVTATPAEKPDEKPAEKPASTTASATATDKKQLNKTEAADIALNHAGLKASEVRDLDVELDRDDGTLHYDVDFEKDGYDYEYEIDAYSGKILRSHKERD